MDRIQSLPPPADKIVDEFVEKVCRIEPQFIAGIYLTGSIPQNDFYPNKSDIDFLVLCNQFPDKNIVSQLRQIHRAIANRYPKPDLSGCYLEIGSIQSENPEKIKVLSWHEGVLRNTLFEMGPVSLTELKTNSITVLGSDTSTLPLAINNHSLNNFLYRNINSYWKKWIARHSNFISKKLLLVLFPRFTEWSILGVSRQLYTLQTGKIVSKTEAGNYCMKHLPEKFHPVIGEAMEIRKNDTTYPLVKTYAIKPSFARANQTIECVNYIIDLFNKTYTEKIK